MLSSLEPDLSIEGFQQLLRAAGTAQGDQEDFLRWLLEDQKIKQCTGAVLNEVTQFVWVCEQVEKNKLSGDSTQPPKAALSR